MAPLPSASEILEHHYMYELDMLTDIYRLTRETQIKQNAYIESFCIHARNLIEFFRKAGRQYVETSYTPFAETKSRIDKLNPILNHQVAHLNIKNRTIDDAEKISPETRYELLQILGKESVEFRKHLKPEYREMSMRTLDDTTDTPKGPSGGPGPSLPSGMTGAAGPAISQNPHSISQR
jgi:hypothetical protein